MLFLVEDGSLVIHTATDGTFLLYPGKNYENYIKLYSLVKYLLPGWKYNKNDFISNEGTPIIYSLYIMMKF